MRRRLLWTAIVLVLLAAGWRVRSGYGKAAVAERRVGYETAVRSYAGAFLPGARRHVIEAVLTAKGLPFRHVAFGSSGKVVYSTLVRIGSEDPPFGCSGWPVDVECVFASESEKSFREPGPDDTLVRVSLLQHGEGCL